MFNNLRFSWGRTFAFLLLVLPLAIWGLGCVIGFGGGEDWCEEDLDCACKYSCISGVCDESDGSQSTWQCTCGKPPVSIGEKCSKGCECKYECEKGVCTAGLLEGEACTYSFKCAEGLTCIQSESNSKYHTCSTPLMPGESCQWTSDCVAKCVEDLCGWLAEGQWCQQDIECEPEQQCIQRDDSNLHLTCSSALEQGESCQETFECAAGLTCIGKTCSPKLADGKKCNPDKDVCQNHCNAHDEVCCYKDVSQGPCPVCGDGTCNGDENDATCSTDCGTCGDGTCDPGDVCSCPSDCGPACGNGACDCGETVGGCPEDCR